MEFDLDVPVPSSRRLYGRVSLNPITTLFSGLILIMEEAKDEQ